MQKKISLRAARVNANMTQQQAGKAINVDAATIANWEKGKTSLKAEQLIHLCDIYNMDIDDIFLPARFDKIEHSA